MPTSAFFTAPRTEFVSAPCCLVTSCVSATAEWHPYTLTSAPDDPFLSVHIQVCGDWTSAVYNYLSEYLETIQVGHHDACAMSRILMHPATVRQALQS